MRKKMNKAIAVLLAIISIFSAFSIGLTSYAATLKVVQIDMPRGNETARNGWGHSALSLLNGWTMDATTFTTVKAMEDYNGAACYCIEPGVLIFTGDSLTSKGEDYWTNYPSRYNSTINPDTIKRYIGRIFQYGYTSNVSTDWLTTNSGGKKFAQYYATQILIWETLIGERDASFNKVNAKSSGKDNVLQVVQSNHPLRDEIISYYNDIEAKVKNHTKRPSFTATSSALAKTVEMEWDGSKYVATLTDSNSVLANYTFSGS